MCVNVFLIVTRFLVLIWVIVEVDERPVRLKMVLKYLYDTLCIHMIPSPSG